MDVPTKNPATDLPLFGLHDFDLDGFKIFGTLPARSYTDKDGNTQWQPLIEFAEGFGEDFIFGARGGGNA